VIQRDRRKAFTRGTDASRCRQMPAPLQVSDGSIPPLLESRVWNLQ